MKRVKLFGVPILFLCLVSFGWLFVELRTKQFQEARYRMPADTSPHSILEFMRQMDGTSENSTGLLQRFSIGDNKKAVCKAILEATKRLPLNSPDLSWEENREALFYKIKYTVKGMEQGLLSGDQVKLEAFEADAKSFLSGSKKLGRRELTVVLMSLMVFEATGSESQNLLYLQWLTDQLSDSDGDPEVALLKNRLKRIQERWGLSHKRLELVSSTLSGEPFDMRQMQGKVVYVEFWSTSCPHCLAELPALQRLHAEYQQRGFEIVAICVGAEPERIRRFVESRSLSWDQICHDPTASIDCNAELSDRFGIEALPSTFLLDATGTVIAQGVRPSHQDPKKNLERLLGQIFP